MTPLNAGLIGYGGFGPFLHQAWAKLDIVKVMAVADSDPARHPGGLRCYTSWRELISDPHLDLVAVATPPNSHAEIACAAMEAGKHVLIEKPLATTREDARQILTVRDRTGRRATVDFMLRFNPIIEAAIAWSRNGCFGRLRRVLVENYAQDETLPPDHWFWNPVISGGILVEHAGHFLDIIQACAASPVQRIAGVSLPRNPNQTDRMMATVIYGDGLVATHYHAFMRPGFYEKTKLTFVFDLAEFECEGWIPLTGRITALVRGETRSDLDRLPDLQVTREDPLPGLGKGPKPRVLHFGDKTYEVDRSVEGTFAVPVSKSDAYADALRGLMTDFISAIRNPSHRMRVTLEDGVESLDIALQATEQAQQST